MEKLLEEKKVLELFPQYHEVFQYLRDAGIRAQSGDYFFSELQKDEAKFQENIALWLASLECNLRGIILAKQSVFDVYYQTRGGFHGLIKEECNQVERAPYLLYYHIFAHLDADPRFIHGHTTTSNKGNFVLDILALREEYRQRDRVLLTQMCLNRIQYLATHIFSYKNLLIRDRFEIAGLEDHSFYESEPDHMGYKFLNEMIAAMVSLDIAGTVLYESTDNCISQSAQAVLTKRFQFLKRQKSLYPDSTANYFEDGELELVLVNFLTTLYSGITPNYGFEEEDRVVIIERLKAFSRQVVDGEEEILEIISSIPQVESHTAESLIDSELLDELNITGMNFVLSRYIVPQFS
jgi:hypothetical protein